MKSDLSAFAEPKTSGCFQQTDTPLASMCPAKTLETLDIQDEIEEQMSALPSVPSMVAPLVQIDSFSLPGGVSTCTSGCSKTIGYPHMLSALVCHPLYCL